MEAEATEVDCPCYVGEIGRDESARLGSVRRRDCRRLQPRWRRVGNSLLEEGRSRRAVRETLQQQRTAPHRSHDRLREAQIVLDEIELGLPALRKENLRGAGDPDFAIADHE